MFFYISFLRPPPTRAALSGPIHITPQISNDLRTESYDSPKDIYYSWAPSTQFLISQPPTSHSSHAASPTAGFTLNPTKPIKLTTYGSSSVFKEIPVPLPLGVREGQEWHLILSASGQSTPLNPNYTVELTKSTVGETPFPMVSIPILISGKSLKGPVKKQERIERIYRFSSHGMTRGVGSGEGTKTEVPRELKITEQTSFDLDKKIWDSGIGLSSWLVEFREFGRDQLREPLKMLWDRLFSSEPRHIVELGAGTGIVSLIVAALRSQFNAPKNQEDRIVVTDLGSAVPLLNHNIASNHSLYPCNVPEAGVLDWDKDELPESIKSLGAIDIILMSDVTYNTDSFPALLSTTSKISCRGDKPPVILLGYKERDVAERGLWSMIEDIGIRLEKIGQRQGFGDPSVEVWFGYSVSPSSATPVYNS